MFFPELFYRDPHNKFSSSFFKNNSRSGGLKSSRRGTRAQRTANVIDFSFQVFLSWAYYACFLEMFDKHRVHVLLSTEHVFLLTSWNQKIVNSSRKLRSSVVDNFFWREPLEDVSWDRNSICVVSRHNFRVNQLFYIVPSCSRRRCKVDVSTVNRWKLSKKNSPTRR